MVLGEAGFVQNRSSPCCHTFWTSQENEEGETALGLDGEKVFSPGERKESRVLALVEELGFDGFDAGWIDDSWRQQPGTPVYCRDYNLAGVEVALIEARPENAADYRADFFRRLAIHAVSSSAPARWQN